MDDFRDAAFARSGSKSRFLRDFSAQNGASVHFFIRVIYFLEQSDEKFRGRNAKFQAPEFFFRGSEFLFRGSDGKIPVQKSFRGGFGAVFLSRWNFFPDTFPVSFCRRNPPAGFPAGRTSAPGVSRVPSKRQVWRGFRDILISTRRVWLRFFRAVPARRSNTRISEGENEQIVNAPRMCHSVNGRVCAGFFGNSPHSWGFNTIWKNELSNTEFLLLQTSECRQSKPPEMNCPASQGDEPRRGGGGLTPTGP